MKLSKLKDILKSETTSSIISLISSNFLVSVVAIIGAYLQGLFVSPEDLGYFKQFSIIGGFLLFAHLGTFQAVEKMYPYHMGKGDFKKAVETVEIVYTWILIILIPLSIIILILSFYSFIQGNWKAGLGWISQLFLLSYTLYGGFLSATYRSGQDFKTMASANIYSTIFSIITWPVFLVQPYIALFLKNSMGVIATVIMHFRRPIIAKWNFDTKKMIHIFKQGFPRFSASYILNTGLEAVTATIILSRYGILYLGYWSFSWMILIILQQVPQAITAVYIPKVISAYGSYNSINYSLKQIKKPFIVSLMIILLIVPIAITIFSVLIPIFLPKYVMSIEIITVLIFVLPINLIELPSTILNAMNKVLTLNISSITAFFVQTILIMILLQMGFGFISFPISVVFGRFSRAVFLLSNLYFFKIKES